MFDKQRQAWQRLSQAAKDLIEHLLVLQEGRRLTAVQALRHSWLMTSKGADDRLLESPVVKWPYTFKPFTFMEARQHGTAVLDTMRRYARLDILQKFLIVFN